MEDASIDDESVEDESPDAPASESVDPSMGSVVSVALARICPHPCSVKSAARMEDPKRVTPGSYHVAARFRSLLLLLLTRALINPM